MTWLTIIACGFVALLLIAGGVVVGLAVGLYCAAMMGDDE